MLVSKRKIVKQSISRTCIVFISAECKLTISSQIAQVFADRRKRLSILRSKCWHIYLNFGYEAVFTWNKKIRYRITSDGEHTKPFAVKIEIHMILPMQIVHGAIISYSSPISQPLPSFRLQVLWVSLTMINLKIMMSFIYYLVS